MNTLIIDDNIFLKKALSFKLLELGHVVAVASDGQEAIDLIEKNQNFDLLFCDVMMPVLKGPAFFTHAQKIFSKTIALYCSYFCSERWRRLSKKIDSDYDYFLKNQSTCKSLEN